MNRMRRGFALILVIWALVLLSSLAATFSHAVRVETATGTLVTDQVRAEAAANAGIHLAILGVAANDREQRWQVDGRRYEIAWPDAKLGLRLRSEAGKVDLNYAPLSMLIGLLQGVLGGDAIALAESVVDWRDRDSNKSPRGAEALDYLGAGRSYVPPNGPFTSLSELAQVMGFDGEMVERLRPHMTVYSRRPKIDALNADSEVLAAVPGISRELAAAFIAEREDAIASGRTADFALLRPGLRYVEARGAGGLVSVEVDVALDNGYRHLENAVIAIQGGGGYEILARDALPVGAANDDGGRVQ